MRQIELDASWTITGHLNGGYLAAVIAAAVGDALDGARPLTMSAHYLAAARGAGPADIVGPLLVEARCDTLRDGIADETARVWDSTGRLVCSARQTAILVG